MMTTKVKYMIFLGWIISPFFTMAQCADTANIYNFSHDNANYEIVKEFKTWTDAAACAVERGGKLVEINDQSEQTAVYSAITAAGINPNMGSIWIGATDQSAEGTWIWDGDNDNTGIHFWNGQGNAGAGNGNAIGGLYHNWAGKSTSIVQEPDNYAGQHHAAIELTDWGLGIPGEWNDLNGSMQFYFIIEVNSGVGLDEDNNSVEMNVYPNPCSELITIESALDLNGINYQIHNMVGTIVKQDTLTESKEICTIDLIKGIYFFQITDGLITKTIKFIKE